jgi:NADH-quinone oxidoreductase subunit D
MVEPAKKIPSDEGQEAIRTERQILNMGPSHPATHGTVKFLVEFDGETIVGMDVAVGYLHRGFEKECESGTYYQAIPYTDRLNYASAILANLGYCMAVEKLLELELPRRCQWARVMAGELSRIGDHLTRIGAACLEVAAMTPFLYAVEARELDWDLQEMLCGARLTSNYIRIGGLLWDVRPGFEDRCADAMERIRELMVDFDKVIAANRIFVDRFRNTGVLPKERCIAYGITGPLLRAAGIPYDLRKSQPYLVYDEIDFDVPIGSVGDNYDRFLVVEEEIEQSIRIILQCLDVLRKTRGEPVSVADPHIRWPGKDRVFSRMEELIQQFKGVTEGIKVPAGEAYAAIESANGELGFYIVSDGSGKPYKVRCRPPSFLNTQPLGEMVKGDLLADIIPTFDMINMIGGECDR